VGTRDESHEATPSRTRSTQQANVSSKTQHVFNMFLLSETPLKHLTAVARTAVLPPRLPVIALGCFKGSPSNGLRVQLLAGHANRST
jgi:hypothetical protein